MASRMLIGGSLARMPESWPKKTKKGTTSMQTDLNIGTTKPSVNV